MNGPYFVFNHLLMKIMKTIFLRKTCTLLTTILICVSVQAQIANWTFDNVLTGTGSSNATAGNASLGSTIVAGGAFNGGTVYYGEGNWPTGTIDLNAYLEFSITPGAGNSLTVSSLAMQIRRSTTGSSGAGPNNWSLRSSLDGYAADVASGVLTANSSPATIATLGIAFMNMPAKIIFRLYGYNATISTGGLNRFVFDNITASGSTVLPVVFEYFETKASNQAASVSWKLAGEGKLSSLRIERAAGGSDFQVIKTFDGDQLRLDSAYEYIDQLNHPAGNYAYRLQMISADGHLTYSSTQMLSFHMESSLQIAAVFTGNKNVVSFRINAAASGNYAFSLYNLNGNPVAQMNMQLTAGSQILLMNAASLKSGLYILMGENGKEKTSTKLMVL